MNILKNRTVLGIICISLSLVICFVVAPFFNSAMSQTVKIIRIKSEVRTGEVITENMIETVEVGGFNLPSEVVKESENVVGFFALSDFSKGDYILSSKVSETPQNENAYLHRLNGEKVAISVTITSFATGLSGKLESGDIISVIAPNYLDQEKTLIPEELKYVEVISVTADTGAEVDPNEEIPEDEDKELPATITLLVNEVQANILAELESQGELHIALVYRGDIEKSREFLDAQDEHLKEIQKEEKAEKDEKSEVDDV